MIGDDQKIFLKGRYIGENIRLLYDTLLYANQHQIPGLLLMVDFEKAVAWTFTEKSLCKLKFGKDITGWILTFYANINSCMHVLGQYSQWFEDRIKAVWIGSRRNSKFRFMPEINLDWNPVTFTVLGVVFSTDVLEIVTINFENKLNEMKKVLIAWSRNLSPFGRITVIKSLVISKITPPTDEPPRS